MSHLKPEWLNDYVRMVWTTIALLLDPGPADLGTGVCFGHTRHERAAVFDQILADHGWAATGFRGRAGSDGRWLSLGWHPWRSGTVRWRALFKLCPGRRAEKFG